MKVGFDIKHHVTDEEVQKIDAFLRESNSITTIEVYFGEDVEEHDFERLYGIVHRLAKAHQLEVTVHLIPYDLATSSKTLQKALLDEFRRACEFGAHLGTKILVAHGGTLGECSCFEMKPEKLHALKLSKQDCLANMYERMCAIAKEYNMIIVFENLFNGCLVTRNADDLLMIKSKVKADNLKFVYDTGHGHLQGYSCGDEIRKLGKHLAHVHLHDNNGKKDEHLPLGAGTIDWEDTLSALKEVDYQGTYLFELGYTTLDNVAKSYQYLKEMMNKVNK